MGGFYGPPLESINIILRRQHRCQCYLSPLTTTLSTPTAPPGSGSAADARQCRRNSLGPAPICVARRRLGRAERRRGGPVLGRPGPGRSETRGGPIEGSVHRELAFLTLEHVCVCVTQMGFASVWPGLYISYNCNPQL